MLFDRRLKCGKIFVEPILFYFVRRINGILGDGILSNLFDANRTCVHHLGISSVEKFAIKFSGYTNMLTGIKQTGRVALIHSLAAREDLRSNHESSRRNDSMIGEMLTNEGCQHARL